MPTSPPILSFVKLEQSAQLRDPNELIEAFKNADMQLKLAIEQDIRVTVEAASLEVERIFDQLFDFECKTRLEKVVLSRFLVDRFVLANNTSEDIRKRVCNKILTYIE